MSPEKMQRVSKANPCPVCLKPDWCLVAEDKSAAICQRIQEGSVKNCGDAGYLHILADRPKNQPHRPQRRFAVGRDKKPARDFKALHEQYVRQITPEQLDELSRLLGVSRQSLQRLGTGWCGKSFTFPMYNHFGKTIGIRRRFGSGRKLCVTGSSNGLFIPEGIDGSGPLMVCEGPTDTAVALDMGFDAVGRPNCNSKVKMTVWYAGTRQVTIIADNDVAGIDGAKRLARELAVRGRKVRIIVPPLGVKDLRDWKSKGLTGRRLRHGA